MFGQPKFIKYEHHDQLVWARRELIGLHRDICLCYDCVKFYPGEEVNCPIAERVFKTCVEEKLVTPVLECPVFEEEKDEED
jgi:hypothetical protein